MIHLAWLDHCPNTVVEALSQGTPIICSEQGGTKELVKEFGVILKESKSYNYELTNYDNPPPMNYANLKRLPEKNELGKHFDISIQRTLEDYLTFLKGL
jgi:glycosyltransferase involved in cell wall biosynthesis